MNSMKHVFDRIWFERYQSPLLWFANTWYGRSVLHIDGDKSEVGRNKIIKIEPNAITWCKGEEFVTEFRGHDKFAKRVKYAYKYIWEAIHWFDMNIANIYMPELNLGFDTLTVYPAAGTGGSTVDGSAFRNVSAGSTWAGIRDGAGTSRTVTNTTSYYVRIRSDSDTDEWEAIYRGIFLFDTSGLGSSATISAAVMSLYGSLKIDDLSAGSGMDSAVYISNPASNGDIVAADYGTFGTTAQSSAISYSSWSTSAYNAYTLNSTGRGNVSKTGITKFGLRSAADATDTEPTWSNNQSYLWGYFADQTGTTNDPKLVVTYTSSGSSEIIKRVTMY